MAGVTLVLGDENSEDCMDSGVFISAWVLTARALFLSFSFGLNRLLVGTALVNLRFENVLYPALGTTGSNYR